MKNTHFNLHKTSGFKTTAEKVALVIKGEKDVLRKVLSGKIRTFFTARKM